MIASTTSEPDILLAYFCSVTISVLLSGPWCYHHHADMSHLRPETRAKLEDVVGKMYVIDREKRERERE